MKKGDDFLNDYKNILYDFMLIFKSFSKIG